MRQGFTKYDPNSRITGAEIAKGLTYDNSTRETVDSSREKTETVEDLLTELENK